MSAGRDRPRLAGDPAILLADEPTAALDAENGQAVMRLLTRLARDRVFDAGDRHSRQPNLPLRRPYPSAQRRPPILGGNARPGERALADAPSAARARHQMECVP